MLTLSYGFKKPETGDRGSVWFPAMETNMQNLNDHNHNGTNSALIAVNAFAKPSSTITSGQWTNDGNGNYSKLVTVPSEISSAAAPYNDIILYEMICKINTAGTTYGDRIYPTLERESATTFTVIVNQAIDLIIYYI